MTGQKGADRSLLAESVLEYTIELFESHQLPERLVIATIVMSNKLVDEAKLRRLYERMKNILDILQIAREDGESIGRQQGMQQGMQQMVLEALNLVGIAVPERIETHIKSIYNQETLRELHKQAIQWRNLDTFEEVMRRLASQGEPVTAG